MYALLIVTMAGFGILGFVFWFRLRGVAHRRSELQVTPSHRNRGALVYGSPEDLKTLEKAGIRCEQLLTPSLENDPGYSALFAVSENTALNLQLCRKMRQMNADIPMIARCCDRELFNSFEQIQVNRILMPGEPLSSIAGEYRRNGNAQK